jgi:hypothetical protein
MLINNIYLINSQTVWEKKPAEFWKILKSLDNKKLDQNSELKELFNDIENTVKHVQDQG